MVQMAYQWRLILACNNAEERVRGHCFPWTGEISVNAHTYNFVGNAISLTTTNRSIQREMFLQSLRIPFLEENSPRIWKFDMSHETIHMWQWWESTHTFHSRKHVPTSPAVATSHATWLSRNSRSRDHRLRTDRSLQNLLSIFAVGIPSTLLPVQLKVAY